MADSLPSTSASNSTRLDFLRSDAADPPVTVVRDIRVKAGEEGRFELLIGALIAEASLQPGHLGATVLRPPTQAGTPSNTENATYRFVYKFDKRSNLEAWHTSTTRAELFRPIAELVVDDSFEEVPGLETWFDLPSHSPPPKWKTTLMSWATIYVLVVALSYSMKAMKLTFPIPITGLILTGIIVPLVAYVVGPALGKLLHGWLHAGSDHQRKGTRA